MLVNDVIVTEQSRNIHGLIALCRKILAPTSIPIYIKNALVETLVLDIRQRRPSSTLICMYPESTHVELSNSEILYHKQDVVPVKPRNGFDCYPSEFS